MANRRWIVISGLAGALLVWLAWPLVAAQTQRALLPNYGTTTRINGPIDNAAAQEAFFAAYQHGQPGKWRSIWATVEGGKIINQVYYGGGDAPVQITADYSRDPWSDQSVRSYQCAGMVRTPNGLSGSGCAGVEPDGELGL